MSVVVIHTPVLIVQCSPLSMYHMSVEAIIEVCQSTGGGGGVLQGSRDRADRWREGECCQELSHTYVIDISLLRLYCTILIWSVRTFALFAEAILWPTSGGDLRTLRCPLNK